MDLLLQLTHTTDEVPADVWKEIEDACKDAGEAAWTWLQLAALNALYLGGGAERTLSQAMKHREELSLGQQKR